MASFFILALAAVLIWLFAESKASRIAGFSIVGVIAVIVAGYLVWRENESSRREHSPAPAEQRQPAPPPDAIEQSLTALRPSDVALSGLKLESGTETYFGIDGKRYERPDLRSWTLSGEVRNLSTTHGVRDVTLNIRLFSCPSYYTTPFEQVRIEELSLICSKIGERSLGLYDLGLKPQENAPFSQPLTFANQGNAINWRYWIEVTRVVAQI